MQPCIQLLNRIFFSKMFLGYFPHLNKSDLALANVTARVSDGDLPVVLNPALSAENVVDAGRHLVPLVVVSRSRKRTLKTIFLLAVPLNMWTLLLINTGCIVCLCVCVSV